jgi:hypothetical protein
MSQIVRDEQPVFDEGDGERRLPEHACSAVLLVAHHRLVGIFTGCDAVCRVLAEGRIRPR